MSVDRSAAGAGPEQPAGRQPSRFRTGFTYTRDVVLTGLSLYGVWHQEHTGNVKPWLLLAYVVILGVIPATHAWALARAAVPASPPPLEPSSPQAPATDTAAPP